MQLDNELVLALRALDLKQMDAGGEVFLESDVVEATPSRSGEFRASGIGDFLLDDGLALLLLSMRNVAGVISGDGYFVICLSAPLSVFDRSSMVIELVSRSRL